MEGFVKPPIFVLAWTAGGQSQKVVTPTILSSRPSA